MTLYLLVRDADGAILAEFDSPGTALRALLGNDEELTGPGVTLLRYDDHQGGFAGYTSYRTARLANFNRPRTQARETPGAQRAARANAPPLRRPN